MDLFITQFNTHLRTSSYLWPQKGHACACAVPRMTGKRNCQGHQAACKPVQGEHDIGWRCCVATPMRACVHRVCPRWARWSPLWGGVGGDGAWGMGMGPMDCHNT